MPKLVKEISSGTSFSRSRQQGAIADSQSRSFRVLLEQPGEKFNIQQACQIGIGDAHPDNAGIYCQSFSASFEGDSRMSVLCTFQYGPNEGTSNNEQPQPPQIRPAEWTMTSSLVESPAWYWVPDAGPQAGQSVAPANVVGDLYDGITKLEPVITISITQFELNDPTAYLTDVGKINVDEISLGQFLRCAPRTVMFRGLTKRPAVEAFGATTFVGFSATYEFLYKRNFVGGDINEDIGWDILVPQTGLNVILFDPQAVAGNFAFLNADPMGQPLQWAEGSLGTKVAIPHRLPDGLKPGEKAQAMVAIPAHADGSFSQNVAAMPIPLNDNGTPRIHSANPKVILNRYRLYEEMDFDVFGLRL